MARIVADVLDGEMDVVLVHKLRAPNQPELAIGSVDEAGQRFLGKNVQLLGISNTYVMKEIETQVENLRNRRRLYTPVHPPVSPKDRWVIVVDDGIATGASMIAALRSVRGKGPKKVIAATAVAPFDSIPFIQRYADDVVCLEVERDFFAVSQFFQEFPQVSDEEVVEILKQKGSKLKAMK